MRRGENKADQRPNVSLAPAGAGSNQAKLKAPLAQRERLENGAGHRQTFNHAEDDRDNDDDDV